MSDDEPRIKTENAPGHAPATDHTSYSPADSRQDDSEFSDFDVDYEESERDTDYAFAYEDERSSEENDAEPPGGGDSASILAAWQRLDGQYPEPEVSDDRSKIPWTEASSTDGSDHDLEEENGDDQGEYLQEPDEFEYKADEFGSEAGDDTHRWPLGRVVVGLVALVLLAGVGYGVFQQRMTAEDEIRRLQAILATAASPAEVAATRETLREMEQQNEKYLAENEVLTLYNKRLADEVAHLEQQLAGQQEPVAMESEPARDEVPELATTKPAPEPTSASADKAVTTGGAWFVNFSSYSRQSAAENWAKKLSPLAGNTVVVSNTTEGNTLYRLRIVGLADRAEAEKVAADLESTHKLPQLWVGRE